MLMTLMGIALVMLLFASVAGLMIVSDRVHRARAARAACQIAVTDAIHRELGAVVAPAVVKPLWGRSRLVVPVPFDRPAVVGRVSAIVEGALAGWEKAGHEQVDVMLVPQPGPAAAPSRLAA